MRIQLSEHFTYKKLLQFVLPSIVMMIFTSIYSVVDGLFVSNYVGKTAFSALNLIYPLLMGLGALGFMIGTGGSAVIAIALGEQRKEDANRYFSMLIFATVFGGIFLSTIGLIWIRPIANLMGATPALMPNCLTYGRILLISLTAFMLQNVFQSFFVTAEKPKLGLAITVIAGVTNFILDFLLIVVFDLGIAGAAAATALSQTVGALFPVFYFIRKN
ncbi:MAG: MATE family efflux transporter, partial [Lachnospiraceae bacterium]|nr:MATE family efflux transporter [Lachnospiraceae bacterium]